MEIGVISSCLNLEIGIVFKLSAFVLCSVNIEEFSRLFHLLYRELEPLCVC